MGPLHTDSIELLKELITEHGFLASTIAADNYKRIWARDAMVCGVASILTNDSDLLKGFERSLLTLANHSNQNGMIPSNVDPLTGDVSFGSLVGRVDANTWFVIGACLYKLHTNKDSIWQELEPKVAKTLAYLKALELNDKGWIYTPLSGNWADEYPVHGYTLYDNALYLWAQRLWAKCNSSEYNKTTDLKTKFNFWPDASGQNDLMYQEIAYKNAAAKNCEHFAAFILPGNYDLRFDAAANGLAMLLWNLPEHKKQQISNTIDSFGKEIGGVLIPAFWPIMDANSADWFLLKSNYSYEFKNKPGAFHNGAIWPVWLGLYCMGLAMQDLDSEVTKIANALLRIIDKSDAWSFQEFYHSKELTFQGKTQMGYTASGIVFLKAAMDQKPIKELLHF